MLYFETLTRDRKFDKLMKRFDLNITLPKKSLNQRKRGDLLTSNNLSKASIDYINAYYIKDFISFGYDFI